MNPAPRGQVLIIGAVAMVVLLGIAALVVDLGFGWMLRRAEQNAVDPAAVAAARYIPDILDDGDWTEAYRAACFYLNQHGFFEDNNDTCQEARTAGDLYVGIPRGGDFVGDPGAVEVWMSAEHEVFFGRLFGQSTASVATSAVAANGESGVGNASPNSLVAFDPVSCAAGQVTGNGEINITNLSQTGPGGYVYVNSICGLPGTDDDSCPGGSGQGAFQMSGGNAELLTEHLYIRGTCNPTSNDWDGPTTEGAAEITDGLSTLVEPAIAGRPAWGTTALGCPAGSALLVPGPGCSFTSRTPTNIGPGVYYGGIVISGQAQVNFAEGVYILAGGGMQYQGNDNSSFSVIDPDGGPYPGRALFFSTGYPNYGGTCALNPSFPQNSPPQSASPDGDLTSQGDAWVTETGSPGTYTSIADLIGDLADTTYLASPINPTDGDHFEVSLGDIVPPIPDSGIFVRYQYGKPDLSDAALDLEVELLQGTTVIATGEHANIPSIPVWQVGEIDLTPHLANITNWADLRLNFKATTSTPGADDDVNRALVSWAQLQIPANETRFCQGMIRLAGQADVRAWATDIEPWAGLLFWQDGTPSPPSNNHANNPVAMIDVQGNGGMNIAGTIYAPAALVKILGNGESEAEPDVAAVQVLAWQFQVGGNGVLNMPYDPDQLFGEPLEARKGLVE